MGDQPAYWAEVRRQCASDELGDLQTPGTARPAKLLKTHYLSNAYGLAPVHSSGERRPTEKGESIDLHAPSAQVEPLNLLVAGGFWSAG